jgi:hypothetical protein
VANPLDVYTYATGPVVSGITPTSGPPGTTVTIGGADFTDAKKVSFGPNPAQVFHVDSDSSITATAPQGTSIVDVTVSTEKGTSSPSPSDLFRYTDVAVDGLAPSGGRPSGCTSVVVSGWGFTGATAVAFGSTPALAFDVISDRQLIAVSPPGADPVDVRVTTPAGTSAVTSADLYTYTYPPVIRSLTPSTGSADGGTSVVIRGVHLDGATAVKFGGKPAQFKVDSSMQITAVSPPGKGTVHVTVTTAGGPSQPADFTYQP